MRVPIELERSIDIPTPGANAIELFGDLEGTIRRFPKLKKLTPLGDQSYLWELETMGSRTARVAVEISYAAKFAVDAGKRELRWTPVPRRGNATLGGALRIEDHGARSRLTVQVQGELHDVPVPLMYRLLAPPFIQGKFTHLLDTFLERTGAALAAPAPKSEDRRGRSG